MTDVFRDTPLTFGQWVSSFEVDEVEREKLQRQAEVLHTSVAFKRVLAELEARAVLALVECDMDNVGEAQRAKAFTQAIALVRDHVRAMAEDRFFDAKRKK